MATRQRHHPTTALATPVTWPLHAGGHQLGGKKIRGLRQPQTPAASDETWGEWGWVRWVVGWGVGVLIDYGQLPT